jgi:competence protein ComEA
VLLGPAQLAVVAVVVAVGLAATAWWVVLSDPDPADDLAAPVAGSPAPLEPGADLGSPAAAPKPATVTVDVAGKVRRPGIAILDSGARVVDALEAAGGVRAGVDVAGLNLARILVDGEQILVGVELPPGAAASAASAPGGATPALVNLNTADAAALDTLPEVGPVTADSILAWRDEHGGFASVDQLLEIDGIGEATLAKIAPHVTV